MERRSEGFYTTVFEKLLPEISSLVVSKPNEVHRIKIERFGGELFGDMYVTGYPSGELTRIQIENVQPVVLGSFFLAIANAKGEVHPGGIYIINYIPRNEGIAKFLGEALEGNNFNY